MIFEDTPNPGTSGRPVPAAQERACAIGEDVSRSTIAGLLGGFYEGTSKGKETVLARFRDTPDSCIYPVLEQALRNNADANQRNAAMELYAALGNRSTLHLRALLKDRDEEVRTFAGVVLGNMQARDAVADLIQSLVDPDLNVKHAAAEALGKIRDPRAVHPLLAALSGDMWLQFPAAVALGEIGDARAVGPLIALLEVPGANIPAIQALGRIGHVSALEPLCAFLEDEEPSLREWALEAVTRLLVRNAGGRLAAGLSSRTEDILIETLRSESLKARRNAVLTLGYFKVHKAASTISKFLPDRELREDAIEALVRIGGEHALPLLTSYARDTDALIRRSAIRTLAGIGTDRSLKAVLPLLSDPSEDVRTEALLALPRFDSDEARKALAGMLSDLSGAATAAKRHALEALTTISTPNGSSLAFDHADVIPLRDYIAETFGIYYDNERLNVLHHRLSPLAAASGFPSLTVLLEHLENDPGSRGMLHSIASQLTNNETYFFREQEQLRVFDALLVPELVRRKREGPQKKIRVLSAGCSSGEEAYTIAMLLEEKGVRAQGCEMEIVGLDVDPGALDAARSGRYTAHSFRREAEGPSHKYFQRDEAGFSVLQRIRNAVTFVQGNLLETPDLGRFDVIFCRNVLIYFSDSAVKRAAQNFYRLLVPGGYLLLGHSESLCRIQTEFVPVRFEGAVIYQKP